MPQLHTFVVVARCGRMRDAAAILSLTPGAISQRIRELEASAGQRLFERSARGVQLNAAGQALFDTLDGAFRTIEQTGLGLERTASRRIGVSTMGSFAANWLVPRLPAFSVQHPDAEVALATESRLVDLRREPVDLVIRHGLGDHPGLEATWLMAPEMIVVASPELLASRPPITTAADCLNFPLLHDLGRADWKLWFAAQGIDVTAPLPGLSLAEDHLIVKAAVARQGLALVHHVYAKDDLRAGRLQQAIDLRWPTRFAYYVIGTPEALCRPAVQQFRDWLVREATLDD